MFAIVSHLFGVMRVKITDCATKDKEVADFMKSALPKTPYSVQSVWEQNGEFVNLAWWNQSTN